MPHQYKQDPIEAAVADWNEKHPVFTAVRFNRNGMTSITCTHSVAFISYGDGGPVAYIMLHNVDGLVPLSMVEPINVPVDIDTSAADRVEAFLARRKEMRGNDPQEIIAIDGGAFVLTVDDLQALIDAARAAS